VNFSIGELAAHTGESVKTLRFWTDRGLLQADREANGYRRYDRKTAERVAFIRASQRLGLSLERIAGLLRLSTSHASSCQAVQTTLQDRLSEVELQVRQLRDLQAELEAALHRIALEPCPPNAGCRLLPTP
jgi:DNA-binding transcriptional MerR regulator